MTPYSVLRLRPLNSTVFYAVEHYRSRTWNPARILQNFFPDHIRFLHHLESCGGVVGGIHALRLLQREIFPPNQDALDVFIPFHGLLVLGRWLKEHGYVYQRQGHSHPLFDVEVFRMATQLACKSTDSDSQFSSDLFSFATYRFIRIKDENGLRISEGDSERVQLVVVSGDPVEFILKSFHSSEFIHPSERPSP